MVNTAPYGFDEDPKDWRLLRSPPPTAALRWVELQVGGRVLNVDVLRGGLSSAVHRVDVELRGATSSFVLRRHVREDLLVEEPDIVARESVALRIAEQLSLATPTVVAHDLSGEEFGQPALLMTLLEGAVTWDPHDTDQWLRGMAELLPPIHEHVRPSRSDLPGFEPFFPTVAEPPSWATRPSLWLEALERAGQYRTMGHDALIHRDFHPGNILWSEERVTGVVDWMSAAWGPPSMDVAHCRMNLRERHGPDIADRFLEQWQRTSGWTFDPLADLVTAVDFLEGLQEVSTPDAFPEIEDLVERRLAELR